MREDPLLLLYFFRLTARLPGSAILFCSSPRLFDREAQQLSSVGTPRYLLIVDSKLVAIYVLCCASVLAQAPPQELKEAKKTVVGGIPGSNVLIGQIRCDSSGNIVLRQRQGRSMNVGLIVEIEKSGSRSRTFELPGRVAPELKNFSVADFTVQGSNLLVLLQTPDYRTHVLRYSTADQSRASEIVLDDSKAAAKSSGGYLSASKIAVMPAGQLLVVGTRTLLVDAATHKYKYSPAMELYSEDGRFISPVAFKNDDLKLNDPAHSHLENFRALDLAISANGMDGVYFAVERKSLTVFCISPSGEVTKRFDLTVPEGYRSNNLQIVAGQMLVQYVTKESEARVPDRFVVYSADTGEVLTSYEAGNFALGAFACFDGRRAFSFLSSDRMGQRLLITAEP